MIQSKGFTFVGDLHLDSRTPSSRIDDYPTATLRKLVLIREAMEKRDFKVLFLSGDVFHRRQQDFGYLSAVIHELQRFQQSGITIYSIVGNHDIQNDREDTLFKNPLNLLFTTGLIRHLRGFVEIETNSNALVSVTGFDYTEGISPHSYRREINHRVVVYHRFYENALDHNPLTRKDVEALPFNLYLLGHDHTPYEPLHVYNSLIIRPGSLTRGTSHDYQLEREIRIEHFTPDWNLLNHESEILEAAPAKDVFSPQVFRKNLSQANLKEVANTRIEEVISQMDSAQVYSSVYDFLDVMEVDVKVKINLEQALVNRGIIRT